MKAAWHSKEGIRTTVAVQGVPLVGRRLVAPVGSLNVAMAAGGFVVVVVLPVGGAVADASVVLAVVVVVVAAAAVAQVQHVLHQHRRLLHVVVEVSEVDCEVGCGNETVRVVGCEVESDCDHAMDCEAGSRRDHEANSANEAGPDCDHEVVP